MLTRVSNSMLSGPVGSSGLMMSAADPRLWIAGDGIEDDTEALQAAIDEYGAIYFPNGVYKISDTIELADYVNLHFQSLLSIIRGDIAAPLIAGKNRLTERRFFIGIHGGRFDAVDKTGGSVGIDLSNITYGRIRDAWAYNCAIGIRTGGDHGGPDGALSSYYNAADGFIVSSCGVGIQNGTLGNSNSFTNGSIKDVLVGTEDDDNTDITYSQVAIETFTLYGSRVSNSGDQSNYIRFINNRYENPSTTGDYSAAVGIRFNAASVDGRALHNYISVVTTPTSDSGTGTIIEG